MKNNDRLTAVRSLVDKVDMQIVKLLEKRAVLALRIKGLKDVGTVYKPDRESDIIKRVKSHASGPIPDDAIESIYREIISACRNLQKPLIVSFLGPEGTYSHEAAIKMFGNTAKLESRLTLAGAVKSVESGACDIALLPIENSSEGAVTETHRLLLNTRLKICGEINIPIIHCLVTEASVLSQIKSVYAHPQSLGQCREWLQTNLPGVNLFNEASNAQAVQKAKGHPKRASIASYQAAAISEMPILVPAINDLPDNQTRFIALGHIDTQPTGDDKTSIICSVKDKVGALHELLAILTKNDANLLRLVSQPHTDHDYVFYMDLEGHIASANISSATQELQSAAKTCKILGSYPRG